MRRKLDGDVRKELGKSQREVLLREQMRAIQRELGDDKEDDLAPAPRESWTPPSSPRMPA